MVCGADLWEVERYVSAGSVVICQPCVDALKRATDEAEQRGEVEVEVVRPARVYGPEPDDEAAHAVAVAFGRTFGSRYEDLDDYLEDAEEVGGHLRDGAARYGPGAQFTVRVDAVRFPSSDVAEVRFQILMNGNPVGAFQGTAAKRDGHWRVTRSTVSRLLGTIGVNIGMPRGFPHRGG
jgi:hypothetical protein